MPTITANNHGFFDIAQMIKRFIVFVGVILLVAVVLGVYDGIKSSVEVKKHTEVWSSARTIATALNTYNAAHGRYPSYLEVLLEDHEEPPYLTEWSLNIADYTLTYNATVSTYVLKISPEQPEGMYFFVDESSEIRAQRGSPATALSPIYQ